MGMGNIMKKLIIYYSYSNNTKKVAEKIKESIDADICEIETVKPYVGDYNTVVNQGKEEIDSGYKPEIKPININLEDYDTIILGTPVWWYTYAPAVATFLSQYDLSNKTIVPFVTNGGWIRHTVKDIKNNCKNSKVINAIDIKFNGNKMALTEDKVKKWISTL